MSTIQAMTPHFVSALGGPMGSEPAAQDASGPAGAEKAGREPVRPGSEGAAAGIPLRPDRDEYCPGEPPQPSGRYWPERAAEGRRRICLDGQAPAAPADGSEVGPEPAAAPDRDTPKPAEEERCTVSTGKVDREIKRLKEEKTRLEQQLNQKPLPQKERQLRQRLQRVEEELCRKDNDAYRRQHAEYRFPPPQ